MSALDPRTPVLIGVGQVTNRSDELVDPITLAAEATRHALADCGAELSVDTIAMPGVLAPRTEHAAHRKGRTRVTLTARDAARGTALHLQQSRHISGTWSKNMISE